MENNFDKNPRKMGGTRIMGKYIYTNDPWIVLESGKAKELLDSLSIEKLWGIFPCDTH